MILYEIIVDEINHTQGNLCQELHLKLIQRLVIFAMITFYGHLRNLPTGMGIMYDSAIAL